MKLLSRGQRRRQEKQFRVARKKDFVAFMHKLNQEEQQKNEVSVALFATSLPEVFLSRRSMAH